MAIAALLRGADAVVTEHVGRVLDWDEVCGAGVTRAHGVAALVHRARAASAFYLPRAGDGLVAIGTSNIVAHKWRLQTIHVGKIKQGSVSAKRFAAVDSTPYICSNYDVLCTKTSCFVRSDRTMCLRVISCLLSICTHRCGSPATAETPPRSSRLHVVWCRKCVSKNKTHVASAAAAAAAGAAGAAAAEGKQRGRETRRGVRNPKRGGERERGTEYYFRVAPWKTSRAKSEAGA